MLYAFKLKGSIVQHSKLVNPTTRGAFPFTPSKKEQELLNDVVVNYRCGDGYWFLDVSCFLVDCVRRFRLALNALTDRHRLF